MNSLQTTQKKKINKRKNGESHGNIKKGISKPALLVCVSTLHSIAKTYKFAFAFLTKLFLDSTSNSISQHQQSQRILLPPKNFIPLKSKIQSLISMQWVEKANQRVQAQRQSRGYDGGGEGERFGVFFFFFERFLKCHKSLGISKCHEKGRIAENFGVLIKKIPQF